MNFTFQIEERILKRLFIDVKNIEKDSIDLVKNRSLSEFGIVRNINQRYPNIRNARILEVLNAMVKSNKIKRVKIHLNGSNDALYFHPDAEIKIE